MSNIFWSKQARLNLYRECLDRWGQAAQEEQLMEELAEAIVAINHFRRKPTEENFDHLAEEFADALFMLEEIIYSQESINPGFSERVESWFTKKLKRTQERIEELGKDYESICVVSLRD